MNKNKKPTEITTTKKAKTMKKIIILFLLIFSQQFINFSVAGDEKKKKAKPVKKEVVADINKEKKQADSAENERLKTKEAYGKTVNTSIK